MSFSLHATATSGKSTGVTTNAAPASLASETAPRSQTVPTPLGWLSLPQAADAAKSKTSEQIIQAAAESLLESGYSGTSVGAIASRAGVAIGNLQYWFPTRSELLVEAWRYLTARSVEELREALSQLTDPLEVLEVGVESIWDSLRRLGDIQLAAFDLLVQAPRTERLRA